MESIGSAARRLSVPTPSPSTSTSPSARPDASAGQAPAPRLPAFAADTFTAAESRGPAAARAAAPAAAPPRDTAFDGHLLGPDGRTHAPGTPLDRVAPGNGPLIIQVNGINTDVAGQRQEIQALQQATGGRVVGVHNATEGMAADLRQSALDRMGLGNNPAVTTLQRTVLNELRAGRPVHLVGYSQGAIITSRALTGVRNELIQQHTQAVRAANPTWSRAQVQQEATRRAEQQMGQIRVETFGGAAPSYPNGPQYVHYVNRNDPVATQTGLGRGPGVPEGAGRGAQVHYFTDGRWGTDAHSFQRYVNHRVPFDQARRGQFGQ
jgi:hypothetical protein